MPAGDASRMWFSEMIETLRQEWKPETVWENLDRNGKPNPALSTGSERQGPERHSHGPPEDITSTLAEASSAKHENACRWMEDLPSAPASIDRDRLRFVREMGRRRQQCLAARRLLTSLRSWWILQPIQI